MKITAIKQTIMIVTDAWYPQVNGVVRTLSQTREELIRLGYDVFMLTPEGFNTIACPTYPEIRLSLLPASKVAHLIRTVSPDFLHIATEGPLGLAARNFATRNAVKFTTAYHTRFPEYIHSRTRVPLSVTYHGVGAAHHCTQRKTHQNPETALMGEC